MWFIETIGIIVIGHYVANLFGIALFRWGDYIIEPLRKAVRWYARQP